MSAKRGDWLNGAIIVAVLLIAGAYFVSHLTGDVGPSRRGAAWREAEKLRVEKAAEQQQQRQR